MNKLVDLAISSPLFSNETWLKSFSTKSTPKPVSAGWADRHVAVSRGGTIDGAVESCDNRCFLS